MQILMSVKDLMSVNRFVKTQLDHLSVNVWMDSDWQILLEAVSVTMAL